MVSDVECGEGQRNEQAWGSPVASESDYVLIVDRVKCCSKAFRHGQPGQGERGQMAWARQERTTPSMSQSAFAQQPLHPAGHLTSPFCKYPLFLRSSRVVNPITYSCARARGYESATQVAILDIYEPDSATTPSITTPHIPAHASPTAVAVPGCGHDCGPACSGVGGSSRSMAHRCGARVMSFRVNRCAALA